MTSVSQSVPWVEKYRPSNFSKIVLDPINRTIFKNIINKLIIILNKKTFPMSS